MANATVEQLLIRIDATTEVLRRELKRADKELIGFERQTMRSLKAVETQFKRLKMQVSGALAGAFSVYAVASFSKSILEASDSMSEMRAQLNLVSGSQEKAASNFNKLFKIANKTGQSLKATVTIFARMVRNTNELGVSQDELLKVTETLNKAFVISGTNSREASNAMIQLSQAFGKGRLDGEEFNAVAEQAPIVIQAIAREMDTTVGSLKQFAEDGKITVDVLLRAFSQLAVSAESQFAQIPITVGRAMQAVENIWTAAIGRISTTGLTDALIDFQNTLLDPAFQNAIGSIAEGFIKAMTVMANAISMLGENLQSVMNAFKAAGAIIISRYLDGIYKATAATREFAVQLASGNVSLINTLSAQKKSADVLRQRAELEKSNTVALLATNNARLKVIPTIIAETQAEIKLEQARYRAQITDKGRELSMMRMAKLQRDLALSTAMLADTERRRVDIMASYGTATKRASDAQEKYAKATERARTGSILLTGATNALSSAVNFLGGPIGVVLLAATGIAMFGNAAERSARRLQDLEREISALSDGFDELSQAEKEYLDTLQVRKLEELQEALKRVREELKFIQGDRSILGTDTLLPISERESQEIQRLQAEIGRLTRQIHGVHEAINEGDPVWDNLNADMQNHATVLERVVGQYEKFYGIQKKTYDAPAIKQFSDEIWEAVKSVRAETEALTQNNREKMLAQILSKLKGKADAEGVKALKAAIDAHWDMVEALDAEKEKAKKAIEQQEKYNKLLKDTQKEVRGEIEAIGERLKNVDDYLNKQKEEARLMQMSARERAMYNAELAITNMLKDEEVDLYADTIRQAREQAAANYDLEQSIESAKESQEQWNQALVRTRERIDEAFSNAWKGAFDSFKDFADNLKDAFKSLLAELAHLAITRPIVMSFASAMGLGGSSSAMAGGLSAAGGIGGLFSSLGGGLTGLGTSAISAVSGATFGLGQLTGINALSNLGIRGFGNAASLTGTGLAMGAGAGLLGGFASNAVFGPTTGIGNAAGGLLGMAFGGPLGAGIGSFIGGGLESALGLNKNNGNQSGRAVIDLATGQITAQGVGKSFDEANVQAAQQLATAIGQLAQVFGVNDRQYQVQVGNKFGVKLDGQKVGDAGDALAAVLDDLLDNTTKLTPQVKKLVKAFEGTLEETIRFTMAIASIAELSRRNPALEAMRDFKDGMKLAGMSAVEVYMEQVDAISKMADAFDGSLESTEALNSALLINKQAAYDLTMVLAQVNEQVKNNIRSNIEYFKQQTQTSDERIAYLEKFFKFVFAGLQSETDPTKILQYQEILSGVSRQLFDMANPETQRANVQFFIEREKAIGDIVSEKLAEAGTSIAETQQDINAKVSTALENASSGLNQAADTMKSAADIFMDAVMYFTGNTRAQYDEVTA